MVNGENMSEKAAAPGEATGFFKKFIKDHVVDFDDGQPKTATTVPVTASPAAVAAPVGTVPAYSATPYNTEMLEALGKVIQQRKTPYSALVDAAAKLIKVIPDDRMRLQAAFTTLDRKASDITAAIDAHIQDLDNEALKFKTRSDAEVNSQAGSLRAQAEQAGAQVVANNKQIADMQTRITEMQNANSEMQNRIAGLQTEATTIETRIRTVEATFNATVEYMKTDLSTKKAGISAILQ